MSRLPLFPVRLAAVLLVSGVCAAADNIPDSSRATGSLRSSPNGWPGLHRRWAGCESHRTRFVVTQSSRPIV